MSDSTILLGLGLAGMIKMLRVKVQIQTKRHLQFSEYNEKKYSNNYKK